MIRAKPRHARQSSLDASKLIEAATDAPSAIDAWLNVLMRLMRLPEAQRRAIRDELQEHLCERVRDLTLQGSPERESARLAIEELGETVQLARRFEAANRPPIRRLLMNLSLLGIGAAAIVASAIAFRGESPQPHAIAFQQPSDSEQIAIEESIRQQLIDLTPAMPDELMQQISEQTLRERKIDLSYLIRKTELEEAGIDPTVQLELELRQVPLQQALDLVVAELSSQGQPVGWRASDHVIEIGPQSIFDRRELLLVVYDISKILKSISATYNCAARETANDLAKLIYELVEPTSWRDNGGDLAHLQVLGGRMFVQAPKRIHAQVEWILDQLRQEADEQFRTSGRELPGVDLAIMGRYEEAISRQAQQPGEVHVPGTR